MVTLTEVVFAFKMPMRTCDVLAKAFNFKVAINQKSHLVAQLLFEQEMSCELKFSVDGC